MTVPVPPFFTTTPTQHGSSLGEVATAGRQRRVWRCQDEQMNPFGDKFDVEATA